MTGSLPKTGPGAALLLSLGGTQVGVPWPVAIAGIGVSLLTAGVLLVRFGFRRNQGVGSA